jgi:RHS repeat-associated protein
VRYRNVYPGIDLVYYGTEGRLEYDWVVAPGTDPHRIVEAFRGATGLHIAGNGDLVVDTNAGSVRQRKPVLYQNIAGERVPVEGAYVVVGDKRVGFRVGQYDRSLPLIIDPVLEYSTFLGSSFAENAMSVAVNALGEAYLTGETGSPEFPHAPTDVEFPVNANGVPIAVLAFVTKLNAAGDGLVYSTYFGGTGFNSGSGIALGPDGSAYVAGVTNAANFPATVVIGQAPSQQTPTQVAFVTKLAPSGNAMSYSTLIGGSNDGFTETVGIALDASGSAFIAGNTNGSFFPTTPGALQPETVPGTGSGFVVKLNPDGNSPVYSTLFGGSAIAVVHGLALDSSGHAHLTGRVLSSSLPVVNAYQPESGGNDDGFFAKLDPSGSSLVYSSYLGGPGSEQLYGIAVDSQGNAYLTGLSDGCCFPVVNPLWNPTQEAGSHAVVAKVDGTGSVAFATLLGGPWSVGNAIAVDRLGSIYVTGSTENNTGFPEIGDIGLGSDPALNFPSHSAPDAFAAKISNDGSSFGFSFRIGGNGIRPGDPRFGNIDFLQNGPDAGNGIAVDAAGGIYIVGQTFAEDFPTLDAFQPSLGLAPLPRGDAFVVKLFEAAGDVGLFSTKSPSVVGESVTFTAIVPNPSATGTVTFFDGALVLGTVPLASGVAKLSISSLSAATHAITARYDGDATHPAGTSAVLVQEVLDANAQPAPTSIVLNAIGNADRSVTLTAVVSGSNPTGIVAFIDNNSQKHIGILSGGTASATLKQPAAGMHSIVANYAGDVRNAPSVSAPFNFLIGPPAVSFSAPAVDAAFAVGATIQITVAAQAQISADITSVNVSLNGAPLATLTTPPYTFALSTAPPGVHTLGVQATDNLGQTSAPSTQRVLVFDPGVTFFHHDLQGNVVVTTDGVGQVVYTENYQPYGARLVSSPAGRVAEPNGNRLWFHGKAQDESTGLQYFGARYYDPLIGRFMGVDAVGFNEVNIHSFNRYAYGNNSPYRYVDPDGNDPREWFPKGQDGQAAPIVKMSEAFAGLAAYVVGATTGNDTLKNTALEGMAENRQSNVELIILLGTVGRGNKSATTKEMKGFDAARREAFEKAGMTDPSKIQFSKVDPKTGTVVEFKGEGGAKVGYDAPHRTPGANHDTQHISWQSAGKRSRGGAQRGNIPYQGERHPSRSDIND